MLLLPHVRGGLGHLNGPGALGPVLLLLHVRLGLGLQGGSVAGLDRPLVLLGLRREPVARSLVRALLAAELRAGLDRPLVLLGLRREPVARSLVRALLAAELRSPVGEVLVAAGAGRHPSELPGHVAEVLVAAEPCDGGRRDR